MAGFLASPEWGWYLAQQVQTTLQVQYRERCCEQVSLALFSLHGLHDVLSSCAEMIGRCMQIQAKLHAVRTVPGPARLWRTAWVLRAEGQMCSPAQFSSAPQGAKASASHCMARRGHPNTKPVAPSRSPRLPQVPPEQFHQLHSLDCFRLPCSSWHHEDGNQSE